MLFFNSKIQAAMYDMFGIIINPSKTHMNNKNIQNYHKMKK